MIRLYQPLNDKLMVDLKGKKTGDKKREIEDEMDDLDMPVLDDTEKLASSSGSESSTKREKKRRKNK